MWEKAEETGKSCGTRLSVLGSSAYTGSVMQARAWAIALREEEGKAGDDEERGWMASPLEGGVMKVKDVS